MSKGTSSISYTYDMAGMRSSKTVDGVVHNYVTQNGKVVRETFGSTVLNFIYDADNFRWEHDQSYKKSTYTPSFKRIFPLLNMRGETKFCCFIQSWIFQ